MGSKRATTEQPRSYMGRKLLHQGPLFPGVYVEGLGEVRDLEAAKATIQAKLGDAEQERAGQLELTGGSD